MYKISAALPLSGSIEEKDVGLSVRMMRRLRVASSAAYNEVR